jgi:hypothetical protein
MPEVIATMDEYRLYRQPHASVGNRLSSLSFIEVVAAVVSVLIVVFLLH